MKQFVRADFRRRAAPPRWLWWLLALLLAGVLACGVRAWQAWQYVQQLHDQLLDAVAARNAVPAAAPVIRNAPLYEASARERLAEGQFPWPQALTSIEATAVVGVTPVAMEFVVSERQVRLDVSFADYVKLLEFVDRLNAGEPELRWTLMRSHAQAVALEALIVGRVVVP
jgi:hypothetical protein